MVQISEALTKRVAELARLRLTPVEVTEFTGQLREILTYVELLEEVEVSAIEPMNQPHVGDEVVAFRPDVVTTVRTADEIPEAFQVPQIV